MSAARPPASCWRWRSARPARPLAAAGQAAGARAGPSAPPLRLLPPIPRSQLLTQHGKKVAPTPFFRSGFVLKADGYRVGVSTFGSAVFVEVWRGRRGHRTMTAYLARGVARPERLQATFGQFGKVKMRFRESRNRSWVGKRRTCRGANRFIKRRGVFRGNLRFKGEGGYVTVRVHRAKGAVVTTAPKCLHRRGPRPRPGLRPLPLRTEGRAARDRPQRRRLHRAAGGRKPAQHPLHRHRRRIPPASWRSSASPRSASTARSAPTNPSAPPASPRRRRSAAPAATAPSPTAPAPGRATSASTSPAPRASRSPARASKRSSKSRSSRDRYSPLPSSLGAVGRCAVGRSLGQLAWPSSSAPARRRRRPRTRPPGRRR